MQELNQDGRNELAVWLPHCPLLTRYLSNVDLALASSFVIQVFCFFGCSYSRQQPHKKALCLVLFKSIEVFVCAYYIAAEIEKHLEV